MAIKILIGGSPCTYWSIAQTNNRETKAEGMGWELFKNYLIAKDKFKPDFFLYENNKSASQAIKDQIQEEFGVGVDPNVRFTYINSALVSAQNRQRFYVTNFGDIEQPEDRGILLKDILETGNTDRDKAHAVISSAGRTTTREYFDKQQGTMACEPVDTDEMIPPCGQRNQDKARTLTSGYASKSQRDLRKDIETNGFMGAQGVLEPVNTTPEGKSQTIKAQYQNTSAVNVCCYKSTYGATGVAEPVNTTSDGKAVTLKAQYYKNGTANLLNDNTKGGKYAASGVAEPIKVGALPRPNGELSTSQAMQIYSQEGKSVTQMAGGGGLGGKTGLYAIPVEFEDGIPTKAISCADGKTYTVYKVENGLITIKEKEYPIKLKDGYYIIRKLTVRECARLQTMPDDYCKVVSDSQAYKALGNGWTAEVIIHLLNHALKDVPRDEEIVVLSMYDGIATGRYCLDKMGFTNVKYHAYEIDKYPIQVAMDNYPDIIQHGDAFAVREDDWQPPQTRSEWLDALLGGDL
jgi:DNA (cytosine-5)-methyltransferase 3A